MISKPAFLVEINKGGSQTLAIQCVFPPADEYPAGEHEHEESYGMYLIYVVLTITPLGI